MCKIVVDTSYLNILENNLTFYFIENFKMFAVMLLKKRLPQTITYLKSANYVVLEEDVESHKAHHTQRNSHGSKMTVEYTEHEMSVLKKLLSKMNTHSDKLTREPDSTDEEELSLHDHLHHHKHHESLKEIFSKHGVEIDPKFLRDLKEWKSS